MTQISTTTKRKKETWCSNLLSLIKLPWIAGICILFLILFNYQLGRRSDDDALYLSQLTNSQTYLKSSSQIANPEKMTPERKVRALSDAVNTLRCLTIPGCFPTINCSDGKEPMKIPVARAFEQQAFCTGDLLTEEGGQNCLVYSFGINDSTEWEEKIAKDFGCDVFAFDPTSNFPKDVAAGVTFHKYGLQGAGVDVSQTHSVNYEALDPSKLKTLGDLVKLMGHEDRTIDILRMDCEGCEWGALKELACSGASQLVKQLMIELHFQKNLGLSTDDDVLVAADAITCLESERWGIASMEKSGCGFHDLNYVDSVYKLIRSTNFIQYLTLKRSPDNNPLSWELYRDYVKEDKVYMIQRNKNKQTYGGDPSKWPADVTKQFDELGAKKATVKQTYQQLYGEFFDPTFKSYSTFQTKD